MKDIILKKGKKKGPISVVIAGIHGNEKCGIKAFKKILPMLEIEKGAVYFVLGNPKALKGNIRYTEHNLNRLFSTKIKYSAKIKKTYEYKRSLEIKKLLGEADASLDIHSTRNHSEPFIITEKNSKKITDFLPKDFKRIAYGFNDVEPGGTDGYMLENRKIGICIECGQHKSPKASKIAADAILRFLKIRNHIQGKSELKKIKREVVQINDIYITKTDNFKVVKKFIDFEKIKKGDEIGIDGKKKIISWQDGVIVFAHDENKKGHEGFLLGKIL